VRRGVRAADRRTTSGRDGRVCPHHTQPCEAACVLGIPAPSLVTIESMRREIAKSDVREGWVVPRPADARDRTKRDGSRSGPAGDRRLHKSASCGKRSWTVLERDEKPGGLLKLRTSPITSSPRPWLADGSRRLEGGGVVFAAVTRSARTRRSTAYAGRGRVVIADGPRLCRATSKVSGRDVGRVHFARILAPQKKPHSERRDRLLLASMRAASACW